MVVGDGGVSRMELVKVDKLAVEPRELFRRLLPGSRRGRVKRKRT